MANTTTNPSTAADPKRAPARRSLLRFEITKRKIPRAEIMHLSRQLAAFVRAGIPILDAIEVIADEAGGSLLGTVVRDIGASLRAGATLSDAIGAHADHFPRFYVSMVRAAELTGRLDTVLDQVAHYINRDLDVRRKIRSAIAYPFVIIGMSILTIVVLVVFALPRFKHFFESLDAELPLPTRMLLAVTAFLGDYWWALTAALVMLAVSYVAVGRTAPGRRARDRMLLRVPVMRDVVRHAIVERFSRTLSSLLGSGVAIAEAMTVAGAAANNRVYSDALAEVRHAILRGEGIARPVAATRLFPGTLVQMVRVGEDTGTLVDQLDISASFYEQELEYKLKRLTTLFEPAVMVVVGLLVGFVALALIAAMYGIYNQVQVG